MPWYNLPPVSEHGQLKRERERKNAVIFVREMEKDTVFRDTEGESHNLVYESKKLLSRREDGDLKNLKD